MGYKDECNFWGGRATTLTASLRSTIREEEVQPLSPSFSFRSESASFAGVERKIYSSEKVRDREGSPSLAARSQKRNPAALVLYNFPVLH